MVSIFYFLFFLTGVFHIMAQANFCEEQAFTHSKPSERQGSKPHDITTGVSDYVVGVETYRSALNRETKALLGRELTEKEREALEKVNRMGKAQDQEITISALIAKKVRILKSAGFSRKAVQVLMENDIVWIDYFEGSDLLIEKLKENQENQENIYFIHHRELTVNRVNKILEEENTQFSVEIETVDTALKSIRKYIGSISKTRNYYVNTYHPDIEVIFESHRLNRKTVSREDLKLPLPTNKEAELKAQGYGPAYRKGMDDVNEWVAVRRQLQELRANPYTTHIEYFADKIEAHISFASKGLGSSISKSQAQALAELQTSAERAIKEERVTYKWWLEFNDQLSFILSNRDYHSRLSHEGRLNFKEKEKKIEQMISFFPLWIMVPTLKGELGIITLNRSLNEGVFPIGLISKETKVHDMTLDSAFFLAHDIAHVEFSLKLNTNQYSVGHRLRHKKMLELMEALPSNKRKWAELVYFNAIHELFSEYLTEDILLSNKPKEEIINTLSKTVQEFLKEDAVFTKTADLGPEYSKLDEEQKIQHISEHSVGVFMEEVHGKTF